MQNKTTAGVALLITSIALLTFTYIAFLGTEYIVGGNHLIAIGLSLLFVLILTLSIRAMCKSKASRNKRTGVPLEMTSIFITLATLAIGSVPFNHFLYVADHQEEVKSSIELITKNVGEIDSVYTDYADSRIRSYKQLLYKEHYSSKKAKAMTQSLRRRLLPEGLDSIKNDRREWLGSLRQSSIWNISTPRNVHYIVKAGEDWAKEYQALSAVIYKGEKAEPFDPTGTSTNEAITAGLSQLNTPSLHPDRRSLAITLLCGALVLTTYFHIRRPKSKFSGSHR